MAEADQAKLKGWKKSFAEADTDGVKTQKRLQELEVLLSELGSLRPDSEVYQGGENSVLFRADLSNTKSQLKKEQSSLRKKTGNTKTSSEALSF